MYFDLYMSEYVPTEENRENTNYLLFKSFEFVDINYALLMTGIMITISQKGMPIFPKTRT